MLAEEQSSATLDSPKKESRRPTFDLEEAKRVLAAMALTAVKFGDYVVVMKSEFDVIIAEEPYHALLLFLNLQSGRVIARMWNKTVGEGLAMSLEELVSACNQHFKDKRLCLGSFIGADDQARQKYLVTQSPVPRKISKACHKFLGEEASSDIHACRECQKLDVVKEVSSVPAEVIVKVEGEEEELLSELAELKDEDEYDKEVIESDKPHVCEECGRSFPRKSHLKRHRLNAHNTEEKAHKCEQCGKKFKDKAYLAQHLNTHKDIKPHQCQHCDANFATWSGMDKHIRYKHTKEKPFKCLECDLRFVEKSKVRRHMLRIHDRVVGYDDIERDEDPNYDPDFDPEAFEEPPVKKLKLKAEEGDDDLLSYEDPSPWDNSGQRAPQEEVLFKCDHCWKEFKYGSSLQLHMKKNHGIEPTADKTTSIVETNDKASEKSWMGKEVDKNQVFKLIDCPYCDKEFSWVRTMHEHRRQTHFYGTFKCPKCALPFPFAKELVDHMAEKEHTDVNPKCPSCAEDFLAGDIEAHYKECIKVPKKRKPKRSTTAKEEQQMKYKRNKATYPRSCPFCEEMLGDNSAFSVHRRIKHFWGLFRCPDCHKRANFVKDLLQHMQESGHIEKKPMVVCPQCKSSFHTEQIGGHYEECVVKTIKGKRAESKSRLGKEKKQCETCGKLVRKMGYSSHMLIHKRSEAGNEGSLTDLLHCCDQCPKRYSLKKSLTLHIRRVHEGVPDPPSVCTECGESFSRRTGLWSHMNKYHSTDEKFSCKICGMRFNGVHRVKSHMLRHGDPKFKCNFCGKMMKSQRALMFHERYHTGEKPFKCSVCSNAFPSNSALSQHKKGVHGILGPNMKPPEKRIRKRKVVTVLVQ